MLALDIGQRVLGSSLLVSLSLSLSPEAYAGALLSPLSRISLSLSTVLCCAPRLDHCVCSVRCSRLTSASASLNFCLTSG